MKLISKGTLFFSKKLFIFPLVLFGLSAIASGSSIAAKETNGNFSQMPNTPTRLEKGVEIEAKEPMEQSNISQGITAPNPVGKNYLVPPGGKRPSPGIAIGHKQDVREHIELRNFSEAITQLERDWEKNYENYFDRNLSEVTTLGDEIGDALALMGRKTGKNPALIYMIPQSDRLEVVLVTPDGEFMHHSVPDANRAALVDLIAELRGEITNPIKRNSTSYLSAAQGLYNWAIAPLESKLKEQNIATLIFCVGGGLRSLPFAALHDGDKFLVENYSIGLIPAFNMIDVETNPLTSSDVLAMGASIFQELNPLPAVPVELNTIANQLFNGEIFLNRAFTLDNLQSQLQQGQYAIVHLATHADFLPGKPDNSYIQFWDEKLSLHRMNQLRFDNTSVGLLVLSACNTALGNVEAEMGFAGLAIHSGVPSALASLWYVSDAGTLALMSEFYATLKTSVDSDRSIIKAEALRQAQLALIHGKVKLKKGELLTERGEEVPLPPELHEADSENLTHPYYWAGFTMIGVPW